MSENIFKALIAVVLLSCCLPACRHTGGVSDKTVFQLNLSNPVTSLDPAFASDQPNSWAVSQLFNGLVQLDSSLRVIPCIAKSWTLSADQKTYTFHLRNDVYFHDNSCFENNRGRRVTAADFVFSFSRLLDPKTAARGNWVFQNIVDSIQPFTATDDTTLIIALRSPFSPFLQRLCIPYCSVVPREGVAKYGKDFRSNPVGTGPFVLVKWKEGDLLILHKNPNYFETDSFGNALPYLDAVNMQFITNKSTEFLKFMNGELDFVSDIDVSIQRSVLTGDGQLQDKYKGQFQLLKGPYLNVEYLTVLMDTTADVMRANPLSIQKIRQAINYAINREEILLFLRNGRGIPAKDGIVPPGLYHQFFTTHFGYTYNPSKAVQLLKEAGFENGIGLPVIALLTTAQYQDIAVFIKEKLEYIGIAIKVETVDPRILREMRVNRQAAFFRGSWIADYGDAESFLQLFYSKSGAPPNYARYSNPQFDKLFEKAVAETDVEQRNLLYRRMDSVLMQDAPIVPLYYDEVYRFVKPGITGMNPDALNMLHLKQVKKALPH